MSLEIPELGVGSVPGLGTEGILFDGDGLALSGIDVDTIGDDGGWEIVASGSFPLDQGVVFRITDGGDLDEECYSGVLGQRNVCRTQDGATCAFVAPPLPVGGPYTIVVASEDGALSATLADALTVIHRSFTDRLYALRSQWPPPRDVGAYDIQDED